MITSENHLITVVKASKICGVTRATIWRWIKSGKLPAAQTAGGHHRIQLNDLHQFMEKKKMPVRFRGKNKKRVLVVDDEDAIRKFFVRILEKENIDIALASDGFEAGIKTIQFEPDLVILDLFMPEMDGFTVCERLKNDTATSGIKIMAISGMDTAENRDRIFQSGADAFCPKPLNRKKIIKEIEALIA